MKPATALDCSGFFLLYTFPDFPPKSGYTEMIKWPAPDRYTKNLIPFSAAEKTYIFPKAPFNVEILAFVAGRPYYLGMTIE